MCIALPGKLLEIDVTGLVGKVDFQGNTISVMLGAVDAVPGDYVLVHAGCAIEVVEQDVAQDLMSLFAELEAAYAEDEKSSAGDDPESDRESLFPLFQGDAPS
ncbi:MAG: HypC/HybG/HupF family hydrogenase formation chaperone [Peptococcaceae bacterium]|nr:HypC/HybG/HupF family hydrogenase formation chaperone [Peptococcaceae bacterium]